MSELREESSAKELIGEESRDPSVRGRQEIDENTLPPAVENPNPISIEEMKAKQKALKQLNLNFVTSAAIGSGTEEDLQTPEPQETM